LNEVLHCKVGKKKEEGGKEVDDGKEEGMMARGSGWGICLVLVGRAGL